MKKILFISLFLFSCSKPTFDLPEIQSGSRYPRVSPSNNGGLFMSWYEKIDSVNWSINLSEFYKGKWSDHKVITARKSYFVNWADFQSIYHFGGDSLSAHWLEKSGSGPYDYDVKVVLSTDRGNSWSTPKKPHNDGIKGEHGFLSFFKNMDNRLGMIWLDGRNMSSDHSSHGYGAMNLYQTSFDSNGKLLAETKIDDRVCECCPTSATRTTNAVVLAYRDRSESEIRDINIFRCTKNRCFDPYPVNNDNWEITGCPVNGPKIVANLDDIAITWYTAADFKPMVKVAFSFDEAVTFGSPIRIDLSQPIGRVDLIWINDSEVMVSWIENAEETTNILASIISKNGEVSSPKIVSEIEPGRISGYPQMEKVDDRLFFAWTEAGKDGGINTIWKNISGFR